MERIHPRSGVYGSGCCLDLSQAVATCYAGTAREFSLYSERSYPVEMLGTAATMAIGARWQRPWLCPRYVKLRTHRGAQKRGERSFYGPVSDLDAGPARGGYTGHRGRRPVDSEPARPGGLLPRRRGGGGS